MTVQIVAIAKIVQDVMDVATAITVQTALSTLAARSVALRRLTLNLVVRIAPTAVG
jgi:hypothetical protein